MSKIPYTIRRYGIYYCQFWHTKQLIRFSLDTDSFREAQRVMSRIRPCIESYKSGLIDKQGLLSVMNMSCKLVPIVSEPQLHVVVKQMNKGITLEQLTTKTLPSVLTINLSGTEHTYTTIEQLIELGNQNVDGVLVECQENTIQCSSHFLNYEIELTNDNEQEIINSLTDTYKIQIKINEASDMRNKIIEGVQENVLESRQQKNKYTDPSNAKLTFNRVIQHLSNSAMNEIEEYFKSECKSKLLTKDIINQIKKEMGRNYLHLSTLHDSSVDDFEAHSALEMLERVKPISKKTQSVNTSIPTKKKAKQAYPISKLTTAFNTHWRETKERQGKPLKDIRDKLKRYAQYSKKIIAASNDFDVLTVKKHEVFECLMMLFDWPDMNQAGSDYNTKRPSFGYPANDKPQEWFNIVAKKLDDISDDDKVEKAAASVDGILDYIQSVFKYAVETDIIKESPVSTTPAYFKDILKTKANNRGPYTSSEMIRIVRNVISQPDSLKWPLLLMIYTGCRNSEIYRIKKEHVNTAERTIYIDGTKTAQAKRYVPISKKLIQYGFLEFIDTIQGNNTAILSNCTAEYNLNQKFFDVIEDLDIPIQDTPKLSPKTFFRSLYSVRKSFSTYVKGDPNSKEILLGHSIRTSDRPEEATYTIQAYKAEDTELLRDIVDSLPY